MSRRYPSSNLEAGQQLHLPCPAATAVVLHAGDRLRISMLLRAGVSANVQFWPHRSQIPTLGRGVWIFAMGAARKNAFERMRLIWHRSWAMPFGSDR